MSAQVHTLALRSAQLHAEVVPQFGGGLARLDWTGADGAAVALMRPWLDRSVTPRPNQLALFPLVPWSNRVAGGFTCNGRHYPIAPNRAGELYPIHGDGWQHAWNVHAASDSCVALRLSRRGEPFSYDAQIRYELTGATLAVTLEVLNQGAETLPFGLGLHPFFPRTAGTTLQARAGAVWLPGPDKLPLQAVAIAPAWSFAEPRTLPAELIDHVFEGWDGRAAIAWPETGLALTIASDSSYYIVYTPVGADFFCIEPVDHLINAHNTPGGMTRHGLTMLAPGQRLARRTTFSASRAL